MTTQEEILYQLKEIKHALLKDTNPAAVNQKKYRYTDQYGQVFWLDKQTSALISDDLNVHLVKWYNSKHQPIEQ